MKRYILAALCGLTLAMSTPAFAGPKEVEAAVVALETAIAAGDTAALNAAAIALFTQLHGMAATFRAGGHTAVADWLEGLTLRGFSAWSAGTLPEWLSSARSPFLAIQRMGWIFSPPVTAIFIGYQPGIADAGEIDRHGYMRSGPSEESGADPDEGGWGDPTWTPDDTGSTGEPPSGGSYEGDSDSDTECDTWPCVPAGWDLDYDQCFPESEVNLGWPEFAEFVRLGDREAFYFAHDYRAELTIYAHDGQYIVIPWRHTF